MVGTTQKGYVDTGFIVETAFPLMYIERFVDLALFPACREMSWVIKPSDGPESALRLSFLKRMAIGLSLRKKVSPVIPWLTTHT